MYRIIPFQSWIRGLLEPDSDVGLEALTLHVRSAIDCVQAETKSSGTRVRGRCRRRSVQVQAPGNFGS